MIRSIVVAIVFTLALSCMTRVMADTLWIDQFDNDPQRHWTYVSDQVMGGISEGAMVFAQDDNQHFARMTGQVSTDNNGGFIQFRRAITKEALGTKEVFQSATGVFLRVRGNSEQYFVHLRTSGTILPWQYYQASFEVTEQWQMIKLPLTDFQRSGSWLRTSLKPASIRSIGVVAFGRDHSAQIDVAEIGFYR
jgi:hypothetical protein